MTNAFLPAVLAALAAAVALLGPAAPRRLGGVFPRTGQPSQVRSRTISSRGACGLAAAALWLLLGGVPGVVAGTLVAALGPRAVARLEGASGDADEVARDLPFALDLLAACLTGGATTTAAVAAVAAAVPGPCALRLQRVSAALAVGSTPAEAWRSLGDDRGPAGAAARALVRAAEGGAPVAGAVQRVAEDARREAGARAERAARRAGVMAVGPLGLCFLPAFLLLGVVPAVLGLAGPLLGSL